MLLVHLYTCFLLLLGVSGTNSCDKQILPTRAVSLLCPCESRIACSAMLPACPQQWRATKMISSPRTASDEAGSGEMRSQGKGAHFRGMAWRPSCAGRAGEKQEGQRQWSQWSQALAEWCSTQLRGASPAVQWHLPLVAAPLHSKSCGPAALPPLLDEAAHWINEWGLALCETRISSFS